ncbi:GNAT family N-acetyltransferase [Peribacillus frigoritolerans]|uniref:GNAT family N-acetyltransferase n=1 Tax=Peribacillus frigoritolerans TaxID=450367 RepID=UPI00105A2C11|nr:GNAT family N-acetyltransferase [Peribacillus frigoritolerans]TDL79211.1 GNAT family N-acetyltransferase [Peribacillus frigoritolerans]
MLEKIEDKSLFMICKEVRREAFSDIPADYTLRCCRPEELAIWKRMQFDSAEDAASYDGFMNQFFQQVYGGKEEQFFKRCLFICDKENRPVGTCFIWKAYGKISTIHWFKIVKEQEGKGLGRALLTAVMKQQAGKEDYPVFLHTHPGSLRAIKLYSDIGFSLLTDPVIGHRINDLDACLPIMKDYLSSDAWNGLTFASAPASFLKIVKEAESEEF